MHIVVKKNVNLASIKNIALRAPNWLGDAVMSLPLANALREAYPSAGLHVLCNELVADVYRHAAKVDTVNVPQSGGSPDYLLLGSPGSGQKYDMAVLATHTFRSALIAAIKRIPYRVGHARESRGVLLTHAVIEQEKHAYHMGAHYLQLAQAVTGIDQPPAGIRYEFRMTEQEKITAIGTMKANGAMLTHLGVEGTVAPLVGISFGGSYGNAKRWPLDLVAELADRLKRNHIQVVLFGSPADVPAAETVKRTMTAGIPADLTGKTDIRTLAACIAMCHAFVTNDSGPLHLAALVGTPTVALFGPTDPEETIPRIGAGKPHIMKVRGVECSPCWKRKCPIDHRCMKNITPTEVYAEVAAILNQKGHP